MPDWSGKTLGKVHLERLIARGGMAEVYLGQHNTLGRKVAVKIMRGQVDQDPETVARFEREAQVVASLRHPNIVQMYDYELVDGQPCLVMEYVSGPSLADYLKALHRRGEKIPIAIVAQLLRSLANALDYAHNQHIVHRDIKPGNVLLRSATETIDLDRPLPADVEPILTDFGLVRILDSSIHTAAGTVSGTPAYMSPEQARGVRVGPQTDIYSVGVMLYEMLAGTVPFDADSTFGVLMKHLNDPPPPIFGISSDLQAVVDRALAKTPDMRYTSAGKFTDEFIAVFNGQTVSSETLKLANLARTSGREPNLSRWAWVAAGALALIAAGFAVWRFMPAFFAADEAPEKPVGRVTYTDFNFILDKSTIAVTGLQPPEAGRHYEGWYLAQGGEIRQNAGTIIMDENGVGHLTFIDSEQRNILEVFDQFEVTKEADNDPNPGQPSEEIVASFVYPPLALVHIRHLLVRFEGAPDQTALIQGLWSTADGIDTSAFELQQAFVNQDELLLREKTEEIINQLVGESDPEQYRDWDSDGTLADPGDGFGMLDGYVLQATSHAMFTRQAPDATEHIIMESDEVLVCLENIQGWSQLLLDSSLALQETPYGPDMEPEINEITALASRILIGVDSNSNGLIEPVIAEGGASTAYEHAYYLGDMELLPGPNRLPPPATPPP